MVWSLTSKSKILKKTRSDRLWYGYWHKKTGLWDRAIAFDVRVQNVFKKTPVWQTVVWLLELLNSVWPLAGSVKMLFLPQISIKFNFFLNFCLKNNFPKNTRIVDNNNFYFRLRVDNFNFAGGKFTSKYCNVKNESVISDFSKLIAEFFPLGKQLNRIKNSYFAKFKNISYSPFVILRTFFENFKDILFTL